MNPTAVSIREEARATDVELTFDPAGRSGGRFGAMIYSRALSAGERKGMGDRRARLISGAKGVTLEIGAGTGLNLEHYPDAVDELILTEPVRAMASQIDTSAEDRFPVKVAWADAENLPVADGSVDTVVSTMVLCTVQDLDAALSEVTRVLTQRFNGAPESSNGGYACGRLAEFVGPVAEVTLRLPPPLARFVISLRNRSSTQSSSRWLIHQPPTIRGGPSPTVAHATWRPATLVNLMACSMRGS